MFKILVMAGIHVGPLVKVDLFGLIIVFGHEGWPFES